MNFDRLKEAFAKLVRDLTAHVDYHALYPCSVAKQDENGNLDLQPENPRMAAPTGVPLRLGIPGAKVEVQPGARVLLGFENGDPRAPVALLWDTASVIKLELNATEIILNGGTKRVAREDDTVDLGYLVGANGGGPVTFAISPTIPPPPFVALTGKITSGADGVKG